MKTKKLSLITLTLLSLLVLGVFAVEVFSPPPRAKAKGWFYPRTRVEGTPVPQPWNVELKFSPPRGVSEINTATILLEGLFSPSAEPYNHPRVTSRIVVPFDGYDVLWAAQLKVGHMTPGSHLVYLEITGELTDGTPFTTGMSSVIVLFIDRAAPP